MKGASGDEQLDQVFDPGARLMIIDQGPGRVAARAFFMMNSQDGRPHGSGTLDFYIYNDRVFFVPSLYVDYENGGLTIASAGFREPFRGRAWRSARAARRSWPKQAAISFHLVTTTPISRSWLTTRAMPP